MNSSNDAVLVGGTIAIDHVKTPDAEGTELLGGSAAYAALAASFYAPEVNLIGIVGKDKTSSITRWITKSMRPP